MILFAWKRVIKWTDDKQKTKKCRYNNNNNNNTENITECCSTLSLFILVIHTQTQRLYGHVQTH